MELPERYCCVIGCAQPPSWVIYPKRIGVLPTDACSDHVVDLGGELPGTAVRAIAGKQEGTWAGGEES